MTDISATGPKELKKCVSTVGPSELDGTFSPYRSNQLATMAYRRATMLLAIHFHNTFLSHSSTSVLEPSSMVPTHHLH